MSAAELVIGLLIAVPLWLLLGAINNVVHGSAAWRSSPSARRSWTLRSPPTCSNTGSGRHEAHRRALRQAVLDWKAKGATIVEIADALGWSRQSVYDLVGKP